jgi:hypothetical protein
LAWATFAVTEPAQHALSGQQTGQQPPSGQQPLSGQQESSATCVVAATAQQALSGQHALSGQQEVSVAGLAEPVESAKVATVPVTSKAKAITLLAMIFVRIEFLQSFVCVEISEPCPCKARASRDGPGKLAHTSWKNVGNLRSAHGSTQPNALRDVNGNCRRKGGCKPRGRRNALSLMDGGR